jgi:L,D-transpeptidase ErfK/SrfK
MDSMAGSMSAGNGARWARLGGTALAAALLACLPPSPPEPVSTSIAAAALDDPSDDLTGRVKKIRSTKDDTLVDLARQHDLGYIEMLAANPGLDPWLPGEGDILLPTAFVLPPGPRRGIVINIAEQRLYYYRESGQEPITHPIGISRDGWKTPIGETKVVRKKENPIWYPGPTARVDYPHLGSAVPPGPDNPMGTHALYLNWNALAIHGTNEPYAVGRRVTRGCIRLYPEDIVTLYPMVPIGTTVRVIDEPIKLGRMGGELYLEVQPTLAQATQIEEESRFDPVPAPDIRGRVLAAAGPDAARLDWALVDQTLERRAGIPTRITTPAAKPKPRRSGGSWWDALFPPSKPTSSVAAKKP